MSSSLLFVLILQLVAAGPTPFQPSTKSVATWFKPDVNGRSACPKINEDSTNAVALSTGPFSNGTACHSLIKIESLNGVTAYGRVTDLCPEPYCQAKDLNLSPKLFEKFAPLSDGVVSGLRWSFVNQTTSHESSDSLESDVVLKEKPEKLLAAPMAWADEPTQTNTMSWRDVDQSTLTSKLYSPTSAPVPKATSNSYTSVYEHPPTMIPTTTSYQATQTAKPELHHFSGRITWYNPSVGVGACGTANSDKDYVIALNSAQYPGQCGKKIKIKGNGKQILATVMDECPTCGYGDLDLSPAVFKHIAGLEVGRIPITWNFQ